MNAQNSRGAGEAAPDSLTNVGQKGQEPRPLDRAGDRMLACCGATALAAADNAAVPTDHFAQQLKVLVVDIHRAWWLPIDKDGISRIGKPQWSGEDFDGLIQQLQYSGYGWLKPEGVRRELEKMTAAWQGPLPSVADDDVAEL